MKFSIAAAALALAGCGGDDDDGAAPVDMNGTPTADAFVGTWNTPTGTQTATCPVVGALAYAPTELTVTKTSDTAISVKDGPCTFTFTVSGKVGSLAPVSQTCSVTLDMYSGVLTVTSYTLTVSADGKTARKVASGTVAPSGLPVTCPFVADVSFTKG